MVFSLGSIQTSTYSFFSPFPTNISGAVHADLIMRKIRLVENTLGVSIGSTSINEKYNQVLYDFTIASVVSAMQLQDSTSASSVKIGEFSFGDSAGGGTDLEKARNYFELQAKEGLEQLKFMNWGTLVYKTQ